MAFGCSAVILREGACSRKGQRQSGDVNGRISVCLVGLIGSAKALNPEILKTFALPHIIPSDPSGFGVSLG
jgi:hypothetical protein